MRLALVAGPRNTRHPPPTLQILALPLQQIDRSGPANPAAEPKYLRTGDLGRIDAERLLYVEGRHKDLIITNGRNIYPQVTWRIDWWSRYSYALCILRASRGTSLETDID